MKALQLRSPLNVSYFNSGGGFSSLELSIYVNRDVTDIDTTTVPDYSLVSEPINQRVNFEIAELIRSKNDYLYEDDFYTARDTATYVLLRAVLLDDSGDELEVKYNFFKVRDGYVDRNEVQLLDSEINPDPRTWSDNDNSTITTNNETDPFNGSDSYTVNDTFDSLPYTLENKLQLTGIHTLSCFVLGSGIFQMGKDSDNYIIINPSTGIITGVVGDVLSYDILRVGGWFKISIVQNMSLNDGLKIRDQIPTGPGAIRLFNPTIIKGNLVNFTPFFIANPLVNSAIVSITRREFFLINQTLTIPEKILCEPKYTPVKVSFINKFGVIQDLVFFKKREDSFSTNQQDFKANILRNGTYLSHTGQKQIINKQASAQVKLSTGFYPEEFNEVFKQLQYSINYWIDDEPAILTGSNFAFKTSVNDKLINYSFDFEYANPDINDIR